MLLELITISIVVAILIGFAIMTRRGNFGELSKLFPIYDPIDTKSLVATRILLEREGFEDEQNGFGAISVRGDSLLVTSVIPFRWLSRGAQVPKRELAYLGEHPETLHFQDFAVFSIPRGGMTLKIAQECIDSEWLKSFQVNS